MRNGGGVYTRLPNDANTEKLGSKRLSVVARMSPAKLISPTRESSAGL
jgi:hypothetical protein